MLDQFSEVLYFAKGIIRNKWIVTIVAYLVCIGGWTYVYRMPDIYQSSARVHVDTRTMLRPLLRGIAVQSNVRGLVLIMRKLMFTQQNILKVAELAAMDIDLTSESKIHTLVGKLKRKIKIQGGRDEIFTIKFSSTDAVETKTMVQAVLSVFSEQTQQSSLSDVDTAQRFIDDQIREYEQRLRLAEKARENFKRENVGLLPGQKGEGQFGAIRNIRKQIEKTKNQLSELLSRRGIFKSQLTEAIESSEEWGLTNITNSPVSREESRIEALQKRKTEILLKYTRNHPKINSIENQIKILLERIEEDEMQSPPTDSEDLAIYGAITNPYVQTIKNGLNNLDIEVATLKSRLNSYKAKLKRQNEQFNTRLGIETELQNLNRDYSLIKKNYLALIDRREKARMSRNVDTQVATLKFKVIDPATVPQKPSSPNRSLLYTTILLAGFITGIALALVKVFLRPTFAEAKQVRSITGLPVLGTVSNVVSKAQIKTNKIRLMGYAFVNILLLVGYSGVMLFYV